MRILEIDTILDGMPNVFTLNAQEVEALGLTDYQTPTSFMTPVTPGNTANVEYRGFLAAVYTGNGRRVNTFTVDAIPRNTKNLSSKTLQ